MARSFNWYGDDVRLKLGQAAAAMVDAAAVQIAAQATVNINQNGQVDTGFMQNSVYVVTPEQDTYGAAQASGEYHSRQQGRSVQRRLAPAVDAPDKGAAVAVGAAYAIYQEERMPFLFPAVEQVAQQVQGEIVAAGREVLR